MAVMKATTQEELHNLCLAVLEVDHPEMGIGDAHLAHGDVLVIPMTVIDAEPVFEWAEGSDDEDDRQKPQRVVELVFGDGLPH